MSKIDEPLHGRALLIRLIKRSCTASRGQRLINISFVTYCITLPCETWKKMLLADKIDSLVLLYYMYKNGGEWISCILYVCPWIYFRYLLDITLLIDYRFKIRMQMYICLKKMSFSIPGNPVTTRIFSLPFS